MKGNKIAASVLSAAICVSSSLPVSALADNSVNVKYETKNVNLVNAENTETTTKTDAVAYSKSSLSWCREYYPEFTDEELTQLLDTAYGDTAKVIKSRSEYDRQKSNIKHPIPWIISCIKKGYGNLESIESHNKSNQNFKGRDYDFDKLQALFDGTLDIQDGNELLKTGTD